jgi:hypothetical protein
MARPSTGALVRLDCPARELARPPRRWALDCVTVGFDPLYKLGRLKLLYGRACPTLAVALYGKARQRALASGHHTPTLLAGQYDQLGCWYC